MTFTRKYKTKLYRCVTVYIGDLNGKRREYSRKMKDSG